MSGEMSKADLAMARGKADPHRSGRNYDPLMAQLLADRDYHFNRAEEAEDESAQLLADLAETTAKLKAAQRELAALRGELVR